MVESRTIVPGIRTGGMLEVVSGLQPGEQIVTISGTFLRNGDRITPIAAK